VSAIARSLMTDFDLNFSIFQFRNAVVDFGRYITGFIVVTGLALPVALAHSRVIGLPAMIMSIAGGLLVYGTIITFTLFFSETEEF
jgi:hypothetical protein